MAETASTVPPKGIGTIKLSDFWKSLLLAALTNVLLGLYTIINSGAMPTQADWITIGKTTAAIIIAYLLKNLGTNNVGQLLKKDEPVVKVDVSKLSDLQQKADDIPTLRT